MRLAALLVALSLPTVALAAKTKVAVTEIKSVQGVGAGTATILSDIVVSEVARLGFDVISQADISSMVGFEKQKKLLGCEETGCLAEIGGALGVDYLVTGQVGQIGTRYRISLLVVDSKKARVAARAANFCDQNEDALARAAEATVAQLFKEIRPEGGAPGGAAVAVAAPAAGKTAPAAPPDSKPPVASASASAGTRHMTATTWTLVGGGAALALGGGAAIVIANKRYKDLEKLQGSQGFYDAYTSKKAGIHSLAIAGTVAVGAGVVAAGVGGWLYWRSGTASVALLPTATPDGAGLLAVGRF
jgi:TolB-like protein